MTDVVDVRDDQRIQRDVLAQLAWDAQLQPNEIGVSVDEGVVTLTGFVDGAARGWAATRCAQRVRGVRAVADEIEVRLPGTPGRTDGEVAIAAARALEWDSFVPAERLDVTVANGWLMLRGEVEFGWQRRAAEGAVRRLDGVRGITNLIEVRPPAPPAELLRRDVQRALARTIGAERVTVEVDGDTLVLAGVVRSWWERDQVERVAWSAPGVRVVHDQLLVGG
ncbi:BON domain-containing protein [Micromonospora sp. WMMD967]|uniref:BON domain-containing protein n=1 Tax=Micromonospora sp. WMMD967 TaxID=3016101 RepID=UPI0024177B3E|nr:BON domain-containing protein [Micromonospora sp. WMMD967]MDG4841366.1 BON domain-containing protein [Micromonospora sp. WMMD967]MDG4841390.1 BON domain-containing protein [Micromonospora sp. WMMD967]MDG4841405.1 BON domain-containing protein [Micromonospora sp. WMMD967]